HGGALAIERLLGMNRVAARPFPGRMAWCLVVQFVVLITWVFFRAESLSQALRFCETMAIGILRAPPDWLLVAGLFTLPPIVFHGIGFLREQGVIRGEWPVVQAAAVGAMLYAVLAGYGNSGDFIYFQF